MDADHEIIDGQGEIIRLLRAMLKVATGCSDNAIDAALIAPSDEVVALARAAVDGLLR